MTFPIGIRGSGSEVKRRIDPNQQLENRVRLASGETYWDRPQRPHLVISGGATAATFLVLKVGEKDFVPPPLKTGAVSARKIL